MLEHVTYFHAREQRFGPRTAKINSVSLLNAVCYKLLKKVVTGNIIEANRRTIENIWSFQVTQVEYIPLYKQNAEAEKYRATFRHELEAVYIVRALCRNSMLSRTRNFVWP